jgi:putative glycosyltransferase
VQLSIVTTLYRSAAHLEEFYTRVSRAAALATDEFEIVLVNDGSPDDSLQIARMLLERDPRVRILDLSRNFGHHRAMMTGLAHAKGDLVFLIDSDLEEEPELLTGFLERLHELKADVVYGVQHQRRGGWRERVSGWIFFKIFNALAGTRIPENLVTVRLMRRAYVSALVSHRETQTMIAGLWALTGFDQVPYGVTKHVRSQTNYSLARKITLTTDAITSFSDRPLVLIFYAGLAIMVTALAAAGYLVIRRVAFGVMLPGWASLIVSVWLLGGLTVFCLGVIGIYLSKVFIETKHRPYTIIRKVYERSATAAAGDTRHSRSVLL